MCLRDVNINDSAVEKFVLGRDITLSRTRESKSIILILGKCSSTLLFKAALAFGIDVRKHEVLMFEIP